MAFKLRSNNTGSIPLHRGGVGSFKKNPFSSIKTPLFAIDPVIDPTKKEKEKPNTRTETTTTSDWRNTGEPVVARRPGEQDGVSGTFIDTTTSRERDINQEVAGEGGGSATFNTAFAKARNQGLPSFKFGGKEYTTDLAEDKTRLETDSSLSTEFIPDPTTLIGEENPYSSYDTGYAYNADFGGGGRLGYVGRTDDPTEALRIVERGENVSAGTNATVQGLGTSQQQGGSSGMVDSDRNNFQSEQGFVVGVNNEEDYDAYDNFGLGRLKGSTPYGHREGTSMLQSGAIGQEFIKSRNALRQKYKGQEDRTEFTQEIQKLKDLRDAKVAAAQSGKFYSPEMEQRFEDSHDTIYERKQPRGLFTEPEGGGRSGKIATPSETTINTGFLDKFLSEKQAKKRKEIQSRRR